jgi:hypothetical protein
MEEGEYGPAPPMDMGTCHPEAECTNGFWENRCQDGVCCKPPCDACSGSRWKEWRKANAADSVSLDDLDPSFKIKVDEFIAALEAPGGVVVDIASTRRDPKSAYLFHWAWLIHVCTNPAHQDLPACDQYVSIAECKCFDGTKPPFQAPCAVDPKIQWDHGNEAASIAGASTMVAEFGLVTPDTKKKSIVAPSLTSQHIPGLAIDIGLKWEGMKTFIDKSGNPLNITFTEKQKDMPLLHTLGASYGCIKNIDDDPHWSVNGN